MNTFRKLLFQFPEVASKIFQFVYEKENLGGFLELRLVCTDWKCFLDKELLNSKRFQHLFYDSKCVKQLRTAEPTVTSKNEWQDKGSSIRNVRVFRQKETNFDELMLLDNNQGCACVIDRTDKVLKFAYSLSSQKNRVLDIKRTKNGCFFILVLSLVENKIYLSEITLNGLELIYECLLNAEEELLDLVSSGNDLFLLFYNTVENAVVKYDFFMKKRITLFKSTEANLIHPKVSFHYELATLHGSMSDLVQVFNIYTGSLVYSISQGPLYKLDVGFSRSVLFIKSPKGMHFYNKWKGKEIRDRLTLNFDYVETSFVAFDCFYCLEKSHPSGPTTKAFVYNIQTGRMAHFQSPGHQEITFINPLSEKYFVMGFQYLNLSSIMLMRIDDIVIRESKSLVTDWTTPSWNCGDPMLWNGNNLVWPSRENVECMHFA